MADRANERHQTFEADLKAQADAAAQARDESQKLRGRTETEDQDVTTTPSTPDARTTTRKSTK